MRNRLSKPMRIALRWQVAATLALTLGAALLQGAQGALSAAGGGVVSVCAGVVAAYAASRGGARSAGGILAGALRAEAIRIGLAVLLLWILLKNYDEAVVGVVVGSFIVTMLIFTMAFFVREY